MAMNIRMSPEMMDQLINDYRSRKNEVDDIIAKMDSMLTQLMSEWEGEAAQSYEQRWQGELKPSFQNASELIEEIAGALTKSAQIFAETDASIAQGLRG